MIECLSFIFITFEISHTLFTAQQNHNFQVNNCEIHFNPSSKNDDKESELFSLQAWKGELLRSDTCSWVEVLGF